MKVTSTFSFLEEVLPLHFIKHRWVWSLERHTRNPDSSSTSFTQSNIFKDWITNWSSQGLCVSGILWLCGEFRIGCGIFLIQFLYLRLRGVSLVKTFGISNSTHLQNFHTPLRLERPLESSMISSSPSMSSSSVTELKIVVGSMVISSSVQSNSSCSYDECHSKQFNILWILILGFTLYIRI